MTHLSLGWLKLGAHNTNKFQVDRIQTALVIRPGLWIQTSSTGILVTKRAPPEIMPIHHGGSCAIKTCPEPKWQSQPLDSPWGVGGTRAMNLSNHYRKWGGPVSMFSDMHGTGCGSQHSYWERSLRPYSPHCLGEVSPSLITQHGYKHITYNWNTSGVLNL